ncbi:hypothetical protein HK102_010235 [Quaeritorhiza haematococci]|nr:hypothetical protein HK102_010235 [Quaeritorhiza haematococci]
MAIRTYQTPTSPNNRNFVLLGCDRVNAEDGFFINKIGSRLLALSAHHPGPDRHPIPVYVLTHFDKVGPKLVESELEENERDEVVGVYEKMGLFQPQPAEGQELPSRRIIDFATVRNVYFEQVEAELVDAYITDVGVLTAQEVGDRYRKLRENAQDVYSML